jgi:hypothetical protein
MAADANTHMIDDQRLQTVVLWDMGPPKPEPPKKPRWVAPNGTKEGDPDYDLAKLEFKGVLEQYEDDLRTYGRAKQEYAEFQKQWGGPYECLGVGPYFSVDAWDAIQRDPKRYCVSSRTRGYGNRPNQGLPDGVKPGRGHFENLKRIEAGESDLALARARDPVFGQQELRL